MSDPRSTNAPVIDREHWNAILNELRSDGFSPLESIKITRAVLDVSLGEAKAIVHGSPAWADHHQSVLWSRPRPSSTAFFTST